MEAPAFCQPQLGLPAVRDKAVQAFELGSFLLLWFVARSAALKGVRLCMMVASNEHNGAYLFVPTWSLLGAPSAKEAENAGTSWTCCPTLTSRSCLTRDADLGCCYEAILDHFVTCLARRLAADALVRDLVVGQLFAGCCC